MQSSVLVERKKVIHYVKKTKSITTSLIRSSTHDYSKINYISLVEREYLGFMVGALEKCLDRTS